MTHQCVFELSTTVVISIRPTEDLGSSILHPRQEEGGIIDPYSVLRIQVHLVDADRCEDIFFSGVGHAKLFCDTLASLHPCFHK